MKILSGSLIDTVQGFLHAGYISAYPRTLSPDMAFSTPDPELQLDLAEAFRLKAGAISGGATAVPGMVLPTAPSASLWLTVVVATLAGATVLALTYLARQHLRAAPRFAWLGPPFAALLVLFACNPGGSTPNTTGPPQVASPPPATSPPGQTAYQNPVAATLGLLHGVLHDALANSPKPASGWEDLRGEVGLPRAQPTPGERHALAHYSIDGWGNELWLVVGDPYRVTSAGPDGVFRTADDITISVPRSSDQEWDVNRHAFFVAKVSGKYVILFHRWSGDFFKYAHQERARALTHSALFDLFMLDEASPEVRRSAIEAYEAEAAQGQRDPLLLRVYSGAAQHAALLRAAART